MRVGFDGKSGRWAIFAGDQAVITFATEERARNFFKEFIRSPE